MRIRPLLITLLCLIFSSYADETADFISSRSTSDILNHEVLDSCCNSSIDVPEQNILLPRQTNFATSTQTRTIAKRNTFQRNQNRYIFFTAGKAVGKSFVKTYQLIFRHFSSGLMTPFRHHLSIGILII